MTSGAIIGKVHVVLLFLRFAALWLIWNDNYDSNVLYQQVHSGRCPRNMAWFSEYATPSMTKSGVTTSPLSWYTYRVSLEGMHTVHAWVFVSKTK